MAFHIPLSNVQVYEYFTASLDSSNFTTYSLGYDIGVLFCDVKASARLEYAEEFFDSVVVNWLEHTNVLLSGSRANWNMGAAIGIRDVISV